ncbi:MAG: 5-formyltetrahydrofolate cyclo-ligase [Ornithinimicrobium sp.]
MSPTTEPGPSLDHDPVPARKAALRTEVRAARRAQLAAGGEEARRRDGDAIAQAGMQWLERHSIQAHPVRCVTAYEPMATEPPVDRFVAALRDHGVRVLVPITLPQGQLRWRDLDPSLRSNPMGARADEHAGPTWGAEILAEVDAAFIPALSIGPDGARLGQGGGYYDRAIPALRAARAAGQAAPVIAVAYASECGVDVPRHPHDILVDAVLTAGGVREVPIPGPATT